MTRPCYDRVSHSNVEGRCLIATYLDVAHASAELTVTVGIIEATMSAGEGQWPEDVKRNFEEKIERLVENLEREQGEFIDFGRALDGQGD